MPEPVASSPKSASKQTPQQKWDALLNMLDPAIAPLLKRDEPIVHKMWLDIQQEPQDVSLTQPSKPYWCYIIELNTNTCSLRGFATVEEMGASIARIFTNNEECWVLPLVGRPLRLSSAAQCSIFLETLTPGKVVMADVFNQVEIVDREESVFDHDDNYLLTPKGALSAVPIMNHPVPKTKKKPTK